MSLLAVIKKKRYRQQKYTDNSETEAGGRDAFTSWCQHCERTTSQRERKLIRITNSSTAKVNRNNSFTCCSQGQARTEKDTQQPLTARADS